VGERVLVRIGIAQSIFPSAAKVGRVWRRRVRIWRGDRFTAPELHAQLLLLLLRLVFLGAFLGFCFLGLVLGGKRAGYGLVGLGLELMD
jgi:hypothetical protein